MGEAAAREARDAARKLLKAGTDLSVAKKVKRLAAVVDQSRTFEAVARAWHTRSAPTESEKHAHLVLHRLELEAFPVIGGLDVRDVTPPVLLGMLRQIEDRGALETARSVRQRCSAVSVYAIAAGLAVQDPAGTVLLAMPLPTAWTSP